MRTRTILKLALAAMITLPTMAVAETPFTGYWDLKMNMRGREIPSKLIIKEADDVLSGVWISPRGKNKLTDVNVDGEKLSFTRTFSRNGDERAIKHEAVLKDGKLAGKITTPRGEQIFTGTTAKSQDEEVNMEGFEGGERGDREFRGGRRGGGERPSYSQLLSRVDANGDGKIQREEAPGRMAENFDTLDANGDGAVDETEMNRVSERLRHKDR